MGPSAGKISPGDSPGEIRAVEAKKGTLVTSGIAPEVTKVSFLASTARISPGKSPGEISPSEGSLAPRNQKVENSIFWGPGGGHLTSLRIVF